MPERLDRVQISTRYGLVEISWDSREQLLAEISHLESGRSTVTKFEGVGASRPVELEPEEKGVLVAALHVMSGNAGGMVKLRHTLVDELDAAARE